MLQPRRGPDGVTGRWVYLHTTHTGVPATTMRPVAERMPGGLVDVEFHDGVAALIGRVEPCARGGRG